MARKDSKGYNLYVGEFQRKDGRYSYSYTDRMGKRHTIYRRSLVELREAEKNLKRDYDDGLDPAKSKHVEVNHMVEAYLDTKYNLKVTTKGAYVYAYKTYIKDGFGKRKIVEVKYSDVKKYYYGLIIEKGYKASIVDKVHTILRPAFQMAVRDGYIRNNPTDDVMAEIKRSKYWNKTHRNALTIKEQQVLTEIFRSDQFFAGWLPLITVLLGTGLRIGEALALQWNSIDFENKIIHVDHTLSDRPDEFGKCKQRMLATKTKAGTRDIPMVQSVCDAFLMEYEFQKILGFCDCNIDGFDKFVFITSMHKPLSQGAVNRAIRDAIRTYNEKEIDIAVKEKREPFLLPMISAHILRHTFCTRLCENETNLKVIQSIMGHADIKTTMDIYAEATKEKKQETMYNLEGKIII